MANENDFLKALNSLRKKQGHSEIKAQSLQEKARSAEYNRKKLGQGLKGGTVDTMVINANLNKGAGYGAEQQKAIAQAKTSKWATPEATKMMDSLSNKITSTQNQITEQGEQAIKDYVAKVNKEREELENQYSDLNNWDKLTGNAMENVGRMAPNVALSLLNPALGTAGSFAQGQASTVADEVSQGRSVKEAHRIGQAQGMMDALIERMSGGVLGLENSGASKAVTKALGGGRFANRVASSLGEGVEEAASTFMQPVTKAFVTGEEYTPASKQDIANSFVNAAAMSTLFGLGQDAMNAIRRDRTRGTTQTNNTQGLLPAPENNVKGLLPAPESSSRTLLPAPENNVSGLLQSPETARGLLPAPDNNVSGLLPVTETSLLPAPIRGLLPAPQTDSYLANLRNNSTDSGVIYQSGPISRVTADVDVSQTLPNIRGVAEASPLVDAIQRARIANQSSQDVQYVPRQFNDTTQRSVIYQTGPGRNALSYSDTLNTPVVDNSSTSYLAPRARNTNGNTQDIQYVPRQFDDTAQGPVIYQTGPGRNVLSYNDALNMPVTDNDSYVNAVQMSRIANQAAQNPQYIARQFDDTTQGPIIYLNGPGRNVLSYNDALNTPVTDNASYINAIQRASIANQASQDPQYIPRQFDNDAQDSVIYLSGPVSPLSRTVPDTDPGDVPIVDDSSRSYLRRGERNANGDIQDTQYIPRQFDNTSSGGDGTPPLNQGSQSDDAYNNGGPRGESRTANRFVNGDTVLEIPEGMKAALNEVVEGQKTYRKTTIEGARQRANEVIESRGLEGAYTEFLRNLNAKKAKKAENHILGARLAEEYAKMGNAERVADVLKAMRDTTTESAQLLALNKVLYEQGGTGMLMQIQRDLDSINQEYGTDTRISDDLVRRLSEAEGQEQIESVAEEIYNEVAPQIPVKKGEKLDAWRRLAMLANPKTQVRNLLGNAGVKGMRDISGVMDGILQTVFIRDPNKRTNSFLVSHKPGFKEAKSWATDYFAKNESVISDGTRYEGPKNKMLENRQIFKSRLMRGAEKGTNWAMETGDTIFLRNRFARSVAEEAATRGVTVADLESNATLRNEIVSRAIKEAQEQTFHDSSALATSINKTVRKLEKSDNPLNKALAVSIKGFMPFTKTPINIAKRAVDYSPLGVVKTIYNGLHDASPMKTANTINSLSKNLTGSALAGLGYVMAESGMLRVGDDDKQEYTEGDQGRQRYSLEIGDTSISLDWLAPTSIPLFFGATLSQAGDANSVKDVESLAQTFFGPMLDMSMMSSVDDAVTEIRKADTNISGVVSALLYTPFESYALQYLPTMGSQLNQTIDPTRRTTQTVSDGLLGKVEKSGRKALNKLPGANRLLEALGMDNVANRPYVDMWGNKQTNTRGTFNDNVGWRALQAFVMPSYVNQVKDDPVYDEVKRLYNAGENGSEQMLPSNFGDEVKNGGTTYPVRGTDSTNYKTQKGQTQYNLLRGLMSTDAYRSASDAERIKMVKDAYEYAKYKANKQYLNNKGKDYTYSTSKSTGRISDWQYKVECLEQSGISPETYFAAHRNYQNAEGEHYVDKWGDVKTTSGTRQIAQVEALNGHGMTAAQKLLFMYMEQPTTSFKSKYVGISNDQARRVVFSYVNGLNLSREEKEKILKRAGYYITDRGITWK